MCVCVCVCLCLGGVACVCVSVCICAKEHWHGLVWRAEDLPYFFRLVFLLLTFNNFPSYVDGGSLTKTHESCIC